MIPFLHRHTLSDLCVRLYRRRNQEHRVKWSTRITVSECRDCERDNQPPNQVEAYSCYALRVSESKKVIDASIIHHKHRIPPSNAMLRTSSFQTTSPPSSSSPTSSSSSASLRYHGAWKPSSSSVKIKSEYHGSEDAH